MQITSLDDRTDYARRPALTTLPSLGSLYGNKVTLSTNKESYAGKSFVAVVTASIKQPFNLPTLSETYELVRFKVTNKAVIKYIIQMNSPPSIIKLKEKLLITAGVQEDYSIGFASDRESQPILTGDIADKHNCTWVEMHMKNNEILLTVSPPEDFFGTCTIKVVLNDHDMINPLNTTYNITLEEFSYSKLSSLSEEDRLKAIDERFASKAK